MNNIDNDSFINGAENIPLRIETMTTLTRDEENGLINNWSVDIEGLLEKIRKNSIILSHHHKKYYNYLKEKLKYFRIPIII